MAAGLQKASLSVYQWGQMSGFAVEEQTQPHLINNIIVLLHTTIKTAPPPQITFFFSFFIFQALAAMLSCGTAEPEWHCHHPQKHNMSQKPEG